MGSEMCIRDRSRGLGGWASWVPLVYYITVNYALARDYNVREKKCKNASVESTISLGYIAHALESRQVARFYRPTLTQSHTTHNTYRVHIYYVSQKRRMSWQISTPVFSTFALSVNFLQP